VKIRSVEVTGQTVRVDVSGQWLSGDPEAAAAALVATMTALPGVARVTLSVDGQTLLEAVGRTPLLYYPSARGLAARTTTAVDAAAALTEYLHPPLEADWDGLPRDLRVVSYRGQPDGLLLVTLSHTASLRALALREPTRVRLAILGLIASLTEFPEVRAVQLDFEGRTLLGLGECSDLLGTPQGRPALLNDERLLAG
jgi:hypothetical protein